MNFEILMLQLLFAYFGFKLLKDSCQMNGGGPSDELQEVEEELEKKKAEIGEADDEPHDADVEKGKEYSKKKSGGSNSVGGENLRVFTQVCRND